MASSENKLVVVSRTVWNVVRSIGPLLISQTRRTSELWAEHQARLAHVEVGKALMLGEIGLLNTIREVLMKKAVEADPIERVRLVRDLNEVEAKLRQSVIHQKALSYVAQESKVPSKSAEATGSSADSFAEDGEISGHWTDKFAELSRARNEPWREELLARALAAEARMPGSVSTRALWLLGTLEENQFKSFACILDLCSDVDGALVVPNTIGSMSRQIPGTTPAREFGHLLFLLGDTGLIADDTAQVCCEIGSLQTVGYGTHRLQVECTTAPLKVSGVMLTVLGSCIAEFCDRTPNALGEEFFRSWSKGLRREGFVVTEVDPGVAEVRLSIPPPEH